MELQNSGRFVNGLQSQQKADAEISYGMRRNELSPNGGDYTFNKRSKSTQKAAVDAHKFMAQIPTTGGQ